MGVGTREVTAGGAADAQGGHAATEENRGRHSDATGPQPALEVLTWPDGGFPATGAGGRVAISPGPGSMGS